MCLHVGREVTQYLNSLFREKELCDDRYMKAWAVPGERGDRAANDDVPGWLEGSDSVGESNYHKFLEQTLLGHNTPMYQLDGEG
ncbi:hypothetical protein TNCV_2961881 [Trichonephila clavipes]|nr:hypothetical protein TNCV_2961881 [Trichonephila clavipes]